MRKLTKEEYMQLSFSRDRHPILDTIGAIEVDQALMIDVEEWPYKSPIHCHLFPFFVQGKRYKIRLLEDQTAWAVLRVK